MRAGDGAPSSSQACARCTGSEEGGIARSTQNRPAVPRPFPHSAHELVTHVTHAASEWPMLCPCPHAASAHYATRGLCIGIRGDTPMVAWIRPHHGKAGDATPLLQDTARVRCRCSSPAIRLRNMRTISMTEDHLCMRWCAAAGLTQSRLKCTACLRGALLLPIVVFGFVIVFDVRMSLFDLQLSNPLIPTLT